MSKTSGKNPPAEPKKAAAATTHKMWGGRFTRSPGRVMRDISASVDVDRRLADEDLAGSRAHCEMLAACGIVSADDGKKILDGLNAIAGEIERGEFSLDPALEDIHMNIESRLAELIGPAAGRLHTARSRNDQAVTDLRLWMRTAVDALDGKLAAWQQALLNLAEPHAATLMPGFTHLQTAQPVTFGHHVLAYVEMAARDRGRFMDARARMNVCPLGSAALAGTSFPIDRDMTSKALGFDRPCDNSMDGVSDRDFVLEVLSAAAVCAVHLSRFAEEVVMWASAPVGFVRLGDEVSTGSSIMPQKRNPDSAELIRGKTGRIAGALTAALVMMKGLPLTYSRDMQEDKPAVFDALDALNLCLEAASAIAAAMEPDVAAMAAAAGEGYSTATDLADWLVQETGMPFREAHHVTGRLVARAEKDHTTLGSLPLDVLQSVEPRLTADVRRVLDPAHSAARRTSFGGTAPDQVRAACARWRRQLAAS